MPSSLRGSALALLGAAAWTAAPLAATPVTLGPALAPAPAAAPRLTPAAASPLTTTTAGRSAQSPLTVTAAARSTPPSLTPPLAAVRSAASGAEASRPLFLKSTLHLLGSYGTSPLRLGAGDLAWLAPAVALSWVTFHNDVPLYDALATGDARKAWLDHSMPMVSGLGDGLTEAGLVALASEFGGPRLARTSAVAMQALIVAGVYGGALKFAAWSNRPYENDTYHRLWDFGQPTQGMPSGHSYSAFALAEVYGARYGRAWTYPLAALVAYSRVYNQDHWPSDVVVGSLLGVLAGVQADRAAARFGTPDLRFSVGGDQEGTPEVVAHARF